MQSYFALIEKCKSRSFCVNYFNTTAVFFITASIDTKHVPLSKNFTSRKRKKNHMVLILVNKEDVSM